MLDVNMAPYFVAPNAKDQHREDYPPDRCTGSPPPPGTGRGRDPQTCLY